MYTKRCYFTGNLPPIINAPKLKTLLLRANKLSGSIPNSISNASMLKILDLGDNLFSSPIPKMLGNFRHLEVLQITNNNLITGSATDHEWTFFSSLANCRGLRSIEVSGNPLSGVLPTYIRNLSKSLQYFYASNCEIQGIIPVEIGNLNSMLVLDLGYNKLSAFIPTSIRGLRNLQGLGLSSNKLGWPISKSLCVLERLYNLFLGLNKLYGSLLFGSAISSTLWNLKDFLKIDLSSNHLHNSHAIDVGNLRSLLNLNLSRNLLMGDILSTFYGLQTLVSLDLSNNILHGHIPETFGGEIPTEGCFSNFSSTSFMKNYALCGPLRLLAPPCKNDIHGNSQLIILHAFRYGLPTIGIIVVLIVLTIMYKRCQRRSTTLPVKDDLLSLKTLKGISHDELSQENNMLGSGSFGYVYKWRLSDGMEVAIKVFNLQTDGAFKSFDIECDAMRNVVHPLVLDYMSNGNLEKWLYSENCFLDIIQRVNIMINVAVAIEPLHNGHPTPIIHCDIKASNILLDEDMVAHVGYFGVAKLLGESEVMKQTITLAAIGYMAPKFGSTGIVSIKSNVYRVIEIADAKLLRREDEYLVVKANFMSSIMKLALNCLAELPEKEKI
ncbi:hypothetical protein ES332_A04G052700v1 [Gossypium tomentosum]|uniref:Protein kinase domain-containing protein n=1 Tax=Gossypium tomentosum TaxID=34277 RepID=A0A5D2QYN7_GOSTO|nr:hypothetical protein ES332_A04G052700v1 [Gossypium tomentosum]